MSSHYSFYDGVGQIIPFQRRYTYPTQGNRAWKSVIKIPPKNGSTYTNINSSTPIRFELPAQGYLNTRNTFLQFDAGLSASASGLENARFQNQIQSGIKRARFVYGTLVLEDVREYHVLMRMLTEGCGANTSWVSDQVSISEGVGGIKLYAAGGSGAVYVSGSCSNPYMVAPENVRVCEIQCSNPATVVNGSSPSNGNYARLLDQGAIASSTTSMMFRRYSVQLGLGLFQQNKLIPLKWMAPMCAIELELENYSSNVLCQGGSFSDSSLTFTLQNMAMLCELLEFDGSYDQEFLEDGLQKDGVPLKFSSWDTFQYTPTAGMSQTIQVPERNRSIKAMFVVQLPSSRISGSAALASGTVLPWDSHAFLESSAALSSVYGIAQGSISDYQLRAGGKMYPAQAVKCANGSNSNGAVEAYMEFAKALNIVGDYRLSTPINAQRWCRPQLQGNNAIFGNVIPGESSCIDWLGASEVGSYADLGKYVHGPSCFVIGLNLETSDGSEISGLNGEEQNDLSLSINYTAPQSNACFYDVFVFWDGLIVLTENNLVDLIK